VGPVWLADRGGLVLDKAAEVDASTLEVPRQPLASGPPATNAISSPITHRRPRRARSVRRRS